MGLETGTTISALVGDNPLAQDPVSQGYEHLNLIKRVLKAQFPGEAGEGLASPITVTEAEFETLKGSNPATTLQQQIDEIEGNDQLSAPQGTKLFFAQPAPPPGWTLDENRHDYMLRCVTSGGGDAGGTDSGVFWSTAHTHTTEAHQLTIGEIPAHSHAMFAGVDSGATLRPFFSVAYAQALNGGTSNNNYIMRDGNGVDATLGVTSSQGSNFAHGHGNTGQSGAVFTPKYINVIQCVKT